MYSSHHTHLLIACLLIPSFALGAPDASPPEVEHPPAVQFTLETAALLAQGVELKTPEGRLFEVDSSRYTGRLGFTSSLGQLGELTSTLRYERISLSPGAGAWQLSSPQDLTDTGLELSLVRPINDQYTALVLASPGWRNAGNHTFSSGGFGALFVGMVLYQASPTLQIGFGAVADTLAVGSNRLLPMGGVDWTISPQWRLQLGLPRTGLYFTPIEVLELGVVADADINTYHVAARENFPNATRLGLKDTKVEYTDFRFGLEATWRVAPTTSLSLSAGVVGARRIEFPERRLVIKNEGVNGGYLKAALSLSF